MTAPCTYGFIGAGNMAGAIIGGILAKTLAPASQIGVYDIDTQKVDVLAGRGCRAFESIPALCAQSQFVFLAVKPQQFGAVLPLVGNALRPDTVLVSIAAGITVQTIQAGVGADCKVILAMPNTPLLLGQGACALCRVDPATQQELEQVKALFAAAGIAEEIPADKMNEIIPVNGSSPAFVYLFAKTLADCAEEAGLPREQAHRLICQALIGSAYMLRDTGKTPDELIAMVCSPGGTTLAALEAMESSGFAQAIQSGFSACVKRAAELAQR